MFLGHFLSKVDAIFADANDQSLTNLSMSFQAQIRMVFLFLTLYKEIDRDKFQWQANLSTTNWPSCSKYFDKKRLGQLIIQLKNKNHKYWQVEHHCQHLHKITYYIPSYAWLSSVFQHQNDPPRDELCPSTEQDLAFCSPV